MDETNKTEEKEMNYLIALIGDTAVGKSRFLE